MSGAGNPETAAITHVWEGSLQVHDPAIIEGKYYDIE